jgi:hypothetical protein
VLTLEYFLNISAHSLVDWKQRRSKDSVFFMLGEEDSALTSQTTALLTKKQKSTFGVSMYIFISPLKPKDGMQ